MSQSASVLGYFMQAGFVVKSVMCLLLISSIASWTLIFQRTWFFKRKKKEYRDFISRFWESSDLNLLFAELDSRASEKQGLAGSFHAGFKEYLRLKKIAAIALAPVQRAMQINHAKEAMALSEHLALFASIGSISPYVGLFGTVWGIMTSFHALGQAQQATIAMVAPGLSEALVATALGLFTAIPAVIAYNRFSARAADLLDESDLFQEEFIALIEQQTSVIARDLSYA